MHGQWDWMNDPEIHSRTWEWDTVQPAEQWKHSHNYVHHTFTNVLGNDNDVGYGILRMTPRAEVAPGQPRAAGLQRRCSPLLFQWGVALHDLDIEAIRKREKDPKEMKRQLEQIGRKVRTPDRQGLRPLPAADRSGSSMHDRSRPTRRPTSIAQPVVLHDHLLRPLPRRCRCTSPRRSSRTRPRREWYLRQMLGSANFTGGQLLHVMSGNLGYQIEHHLFPDLPSNRYPEIARAGPGAVREVRHPLHHRSAVPAVRPGAAHDHEAVAALENGAARRTAARQAGPGRLTNRLTASFRRSGSREPVCPAGA